LAEADFVLVLDSDVPWIPSKNGPNPQARIFRCSTKLAGLVEGTQEVYLSEHPLTNLP
jgi:hypothetical protein